MPRTFSGRRCDARQRLGQRQRRQQQQPARQHDQRGEHPVPRGRAAAPPHPATARRPARRRAPASAATSPWPRRSRRTGRRRPRWPPPSPRRRPSPCSPRATPSTAMFGANRQTSDASMCSTMPAISGLRRPSESDSGPTISWPRANPASVPVSVSCATDEDTDRSSAILGSAGRYMSMVSGPSATRAPSTSDHADAARRLRLPFRGRGFHACAGHVHVDRCCHGSG